MSPYNLFAEIPDFDTDYVGENVDLMANARVIAYPSGDVDIMVGTTAMFSPVRHRAAPAAREKGKKSEGDNLLRSMRRARSKLRRLALSNEFQYFVTLTLDPEKIDRYDGAAVTKALGRWCDNMVRRHGLRYILVPEQHKDGAFHFHGFMAGDGLVAVDSGVEWDGRPVYNLPQWTLGFTTAQELYGTYSAAVGYCCKYIGKQQNQRPLGRWYYSGGDLREPDAVTCCLDYGQIKEQFAADACELDTAAGRLLVVHTTYCDEGKEEPQHVDTESIRCSCGTAAPVAHGGQSASPNDSDGDAGRHAEISSGAGSIRQI